MNLTPDHMKLCPHVFLPVSQGEKPKISIVNAGQTQDAGDQAGRLGCVKGKDPVGPQPDTRWWMGLAEGFARAGRHPFGRKRFQYIMP